MAPQKIPTLWYFVEYYPLTPSGKIQKNILQEMIASGQLKPVM
jgi:fatty-acyl-CoA synthase